MKKIAKHRFISLMSLVSALFVAGGFAWSCVTLESMGSAPFILHFNDIDGITAVGGIFSIVFMGVLGLVIVGVNFFIALELEERDQVIGKILVSTTLLMAILLFISFAAIINVN